MTEEDAQLQALIDRVQAIGNNPHHPVAIAMNFLIQAVEIANRDQDPAARMILTSTLRNCLNKIETPNLNELREAQGTLQ